MLANLTEKKNIVIAVSDIMDLQATGRNPKHCNTLSALSVSLAGTQQVGEGSTKMLPDTRPQGLCRPLHQCHPSGYPDKTIKPPEI